MRKAPRRGAARAGLAGGGSLARAGSLVRAGSLARGGPPGCEGPRTCDERLLVLARTRGHSRCAEVAFERFSRLGEHAAIWLGVGVGGALLDAPRAARWRRAVGVVAGTYALNTTLKLVIRRRRPELPGLPPLTSTPTRLSFPSAHSSTSFAAALMYSRLGLPGPPLLALACAFAYSRLYLGVHYPSDVLAGAALGALVGMRFRDPPAGERGARG